GLPPMRPSASPQNSRLKQLTAFFQTKCSQCGRGPAPDEALSLTTKLKTPTVDRILSDKMQFIVGGGLPPMRPSASPQVSRLKQLTAFFQTKCSQCGRGLAPDEALSLTTKLKAQTVDRILSDKCSQCGRGLAPDEALSLTTRLKSQTVDRILSDKMQSMWEGTCPR
ncbi:hypothetical protein QN402_28880, partial [Pseudomonas sp. FG1]|nr:hypothetical protein [Pseudomonas sp. FG1]